MRTRPAVVSLHAAAALTCVCAQVGFKDVVSTLVEGLPSEADILVKMVMALRVSPTSLPRAVLVLCTAMASLSTTRFDGTHGGAQHKDSLSEEAVGALEKTHPWPTKELVLGAVQTIVSAVGDEAALVAFQEACEHYSRELTMAM